MNRRAEQAAALGVFGAALAAFRNFGPIVWPYGVGPDWSLVTQTWFFIVDLLWVVAMVATFWRQPGGRM